MISFLFLSPQIQDGDHYVKRPPPLRKSRTCHNHHVVETFFSGPWNLEYIPITIFLNVLINTKSNMAAILVSSFSADATIKRCPTAFSYGNIDID